MFPVSEEEKDRITINEKGITLKSYGLPLVFWGYLSAILVVVFAMGLAVKGPMIKLYNTDDTINKVLVLAAAATIILVPLSTILFYFYEKFITKKDDQLIITHRVFWLPVFSTKHPLESKEAFEILHFMDSPNVAKLQQDPNLKGFENKGYFQLFAKKKDGKLLLVDRSSRKADLKKIQMLLSKY
ncbi:hypothetical protein [Bacteriovorax sp. DB6_IX]|uniref:hypothetical protein n=1 Tax=Bacteriovorax sp. DB6_IX TaxID=1353530 RepID=UPI00038A1D3C|nr:hypothetical protein [Bacteriovorax sp. DB6_IX]EQC48591.1 hypothetical protein M901_1044 [Bacteriovorax sp. DB6_IX]